MYISGIPSSDRPFGSRWGRIRGFWVWRFWVSLHHFSQFTHSSVWIFSWPLIFGWLFFRSSSQSREKLFKEPFDCHFFDLELDGPTIDQKGSLEAGVESPVNRIVVGESSVCLIMRLLRGRILSLLVVDSMFIDINDSAWCRDSVIALWFKIIRCSRFTALSHSAFYLTLLQSSIPTGWSNFILVDCEYCNSGAPAIDFIGYRSVAGIFIKIA